MIAGFSKEELLSVPVDTARSMRLSCGCRGLARLHKRLEPAKVLAQHEFRMLAEGCSKCSSYRAAQNGVPNLCGNERPAILRIGSKFYEAFILDFRAGDRPP